MLYAQLDRQCRPDKHRNKHFCFMAQNYRQQIENQKPRKICHIQFVTLIAICFLALQAVTVRGTQLTKTALTSLNDLCQKYRISTPDFELIHAEAGMDNRPTFKYRVTIGEYTGVSPNYHKTKP